MRIARILSVCPTNLPNKQKNSAHPHTQHKTSFKLYTPVRLPLLGSQSLTTRSGDPEAIVLPNGSQASAYMDDFGAATSGGVRVTIAALLLFLLFADDVVVFERSQSLMVRSNEPDATQFCSRLNSFFSYELDVGGGGKERTRKSNIGHNRCENQFVMVRCRCLSRRWNGDSKL